MHTTTSDIVVRYAETDQMGVAYHGNLFPWFEVGRTDWIRDQGMSYRDFEKTGHFLAIAGGDFQYVRPIFYDDKLTVTTELEKTGRTSLTFRYQVHRDSELVATGATRHVCFNRDRKPVPFPADLQKILNGASD